MSLSNVRPNLIDDVILYEEPIARDEVTFKNNSGSTGHWLVGRTLIASGSYFVPANVNHADCVLLTNTDSLANNGTQKVAVIGLRGLCELNVDRMDFGPGDTAFDTDAQAQVDELAGQGCKMVQEPDVSSAG